MRKIICSYLYTLYPKKDDVTDTEYRICRYKDIDGKEFVAKGYFLPTSKGTEIHLAGDFKEDETGKSAFISEDCEDCMELLPKENEKIEEYLCSAGLSSDEAKKYALEHGPEIYDLLSSDDCPGKLYNIRVFYMKQHEGKELFRLLYKSDVKGNRFLYIYDKETDPEKSVKENPYMLMNYGLNFYECERLSAKNKFRTSFRNRLEAGVIEVLKEAENGGILFSGKLKSPGFFRSKRLRPQLLDVLNDRSAFNIAGSTCISYEMLYLQTLKLLSRDIEEKDFVHVIKEMAHEGKLFISKSRPSDSSETRFMVYLHETAMEEYGTAKMLSSFLSHPAPKIPFLERRIWNTENRLQILLSDEQKLAVKTALSFPVTIITGGPGTGKTAVQKVLIETFERVYKGAKKIFLMAPTGMAVKRMSEATGRPAVTIHSAVGISWGSDEIKEVDADLVIIDEASMIDSKTMYCLLKSLKKSCQLIIVGDTAQLPSVGCGNVLSELIESNVIQIVRLTNVFRQAAGSTIAVNAARIKSGETKLLTENEDFVLINEERKSEKIVKVCENIYLNAVKEKGVQNVTVLSPFRKKTVTGTDELNPVLRSSLGRKSEASFKTGRTVFYEGDKVLYMKNKGELINGDVGFIRKIKHIHSSVEATIDFSGRRVTLRGKDLTNLTLAYATTIHKSQGSEYDTVILIIDPAHEKMLSRKLIYTAITRAKKRCYIIGSEKCLKTAITKEDKKRESNLSALLRESYVESRKRFIR